MKTNFFFLSNKKSPPVGVGFSAFSDSVLCSLPIRRAAFSDFIQAKGRLIRPSLTGLVGCDKSTAFLPLASGEQWSKPGHPGRLAGHRAFFLGTRMEEAPQGGIISYQVNALRLLRQSR
jgi:hypothetical protein